MELSSWKAAGFIDGGGICRLGLKVYQTKQFGEQSSLSVNQISMTFASVQVLGSLTRDRCFSGRGNDCYVVEAGRVEKL